jgi:protein SCO1/2
MNSSLRYVILGILTFLACGGIIYYQINHQPLAYVRDKKDDTKIEIGGDFKLIDQYGKIRSNQEFKGKLMLIYFGYSFCPDICPLGLQNITQALNNLGRDRDQVIPIFITVDPKRDTPEHLAIYASNFHPSFVMLTGSTGEIEHLKKKFKVYSAPAKTAHPTEDYLIDHTTLVYLMDKNGHYLESFAHSTTPEKITQILQKALFQK